MVKCPLCKSSEKVVKSGFRYNDSGKKQRFQCNSCNHLFVKDDGFWKMKHKPKIIAEALSCKKRGMPYEEVSKHFKEYKKADVSAVTIYNWVKKYGKPLDGFNKKQTPNLSGKINTDEFVFKVKKK
jgi:transposase-like protein